MFSEYGIPQTVVTDNGPPFSSKEFAAFANQYCLDHITSSPCYPQSNGFIERMVQTVKQSMKECAAGGHDPNLAMLVYRATPLTTSIPSPGELLNGQKYRALLLTRSAIQNPHSQEMGGRLKFEEINSLLLPRSLRNFMGQKCFALLAPRERPAHITARCCL